MMAQEYPRLAASIREFTHFSILTPERAKVESIDNGVSLNWPECRGCSFAVRIQSDSSGRGIDGQMRALVAEQRRIDSVNKDRRTVVQEFDVIDGPPVPFVSDAGRGLLIDESCGDCSSRSVVFERGGKIATISMTGDDDVPELSRHTCEMTVAAKTFVWGR
jgi:hypothetical protein